MARKDSTDVDSYMANLDHPLKPEIELVREIVLGTDLEITEKVKWNAPSFGIGDDDRITLNLKDAKNLRIIFHRGAVARNSDDFEFADPTGLVVWAARDRGVVSFSTANEINEAREMLAQLVRSWLTANSSISEAISGSPES